MLLLLLLLASNAPLLHADESAPASSSPFPTEPLVAPLFICDRYPGLGCMTLNIGTPAQTVLALVDTGSSHIYAAADQAMGAGLDCTGQTYTPANSSTSVASPPPSPSADVGAAAGMPPCMTQIHYQGQTVSGSCYTDLVGINGANSTDDLALLSATKIHGVAECAIIGWSVSSPGASALLATLDLPVVFALDLTSTCSVRSLCPWVAPQTGSIHLGGVDATSYYGGLACTPVQRQVGNGGAAQQQQLWKIRYDFTLEGGVNYKSAPRPGQYGFVDSGTSNLLVTPEIWSELEIAFREAHPDEDMPEPYEYLIDCSLREGLPDLVFALSGVSSEDDAEAKLILEPDIYVQPFFLANGTQTSQCLWRVGKASSTSNVSVLGAALFQKYYVAFDYERDLVAFGLKRCNEDLAPCLDLNVGDANLPDTCAGVMNDDATSDADDATFDVDDATFDVDATSGVGMCSVHALSVAVVAFLGMSPYTSILLC